MKRSIRTLLPLPIVVSALLVPGAAQAKADVDVVGVRLGNRCEITTENYDRMVVDISGTIVGMNLSEQGGVLTVTTRNVPFDDDDFVDVNATFAEDDLGWVFEEVHASTNSIEITFDQDVYAGQLKVSVLKGGINGEKGIYRLVIDAWEMARDDCP